LLWLWFESEAFDATSSTRSQGTFGLWLEKHLLLSVGKEATRIKGALPGGSREAKEALVLGKLPEEAGLHLSLGDREMTFTLKAEKMALSGLVLPTVLAGGDDDEPKALIEAPRRPRKRKSSTVELERERAADERHEAFYERMTLTREVEALVEALYGDFLALRLGDVWSAVVEPALAAWIRGGKIDSDRYRKARDSALSSAGGKSGIAQASRRRAKRR
jgi:hypothetical protein